MRKLQLTAAGLALAICNAPPQAQTENTGDSVAVAAACTQDVRLRRAGPTPDRGDAPVYVNAEQVDLSRLGRSRFVGSVQLERADQQIETGELVYRREIGEVLLPHALRYSDQDYALAASSARYVLDDATATFDDVRFEVVGSTANGEARRLTVHQSGRAELVSPNFTTCPGETPAWEISASRVEMDRERGTGVARNATLRFQGVPLLYLPWLSFPIDDRRKSGFLYPSFSTTSENGVAVSWPYYWNIRPNLDATLIPRFISDRGPAIGTEVRFLTRRAGGQLNTEYLPDDNDFQGRDRYLIQARSSYSLTRRFTARTHLQRASDKQYFLDFGNDITETTRTFLRSSLGVRGGGAGWNLLLELDDFQTLDRAIPARDEPYSRLPRLALDGRWPLYGNLDFTLDSEVVNFVRDTGVEGGRLDLYPALEWRLLRPGWYLAPRAGFRYTQYALDDAEGTDSPSRTLPILSVDAGMIFERAMQSGDRMTLEPRLFYLYVPFEEQSQLPDFDTSELTFGFSQLFHTNRFSGADRQADANQLSVAVTSRFTDAESGRQYLDISLGQTYFFRDQRVQLNDQPRTDLAASPVTAEANYRPLENWSASAGLQWDPERTRTDLALLGINYEDDRGRRVQAGYRFRRDSVDQFDIRARYPVSESWQLLGGWNFSFKEDTTLEGVLGFEYETCCWALKFIGRQFVNDRDGSDQSGVFLELHLKGLGSLGRQPYNLFGRGTFQP